MAACGTQTYPSMYEEGRGTREIGCRHDCADNDVIPKEYKVAMQAI